MALVAAMLDVRIEDLTTVTLAHELAHIRRYDYLVNIAQTIVEILGFYNPLVKPPHIEVKKDRIAYWQKNGAQITDAVKKLLS